MTLGEATDRLSIVNVKLFMIQDKVHAFAGEEPEMYAERTPQETQDVFKKLAALNLERNMLIRTVDECLAEAVSTGQVAIGGTVKLV